MKAKGLMAAMIVGIMVVSGLGIVSIGADNVPIITPAITLPNEPNTVQRVVLLEDFTSWQCPPCASFNPVLSGVIATNGYTKVAPAMYHVWWPNYDDDPIYQYDKEEVTNKVNYYGCNYVPWFMVDGTLRDTSTTASVLQGYINERLAVPANISLNTQGWISGGVGEIGVTVTAVENIAATDLYVRVMLWETDITRPLWNYRLASYDTPPYPNGETILEWGVWDYVPDEKGTPIWPSGATAGDKVEFVVPFDISDVDGLVEANVGATIFVQSQSTKNVEQAAVEEFANVPPRPMSVVAPAPGTAEQILSGTIPIIWSATDTEDLDSTLDISLDYSADGGLTWTNIMSGTDNNVAPFTYNWNTVAGGIPDGPAYKIRVKAVDSIGDFGYAWSSESFSIDNTVDDEWYFQLEPNGSDKTLNMVPVENTPNEIATASITSAGDYTVGKWKTTQTFTGKAIAGDWTFNVYGKVPNPSLTPLSGSLFAKVYTSSNTVTPIYTTAIDNENVGSFQTTHKFTWTETLSGNIADGDSLVVEILVRAIGGPYPASHGETTNPGFDTTATPWTFYNWVSSTTMVGTATGTRVTSGGNPGAFVDITLTPPGTGATTLGICSGYWQQSFTTGFVPYNAQVSFDVTALAIKTNNLQYTYLYVFLQTAAGDPNVLDRVWRLKIDNTFPWESHTVDLSDYIVANTQYFLKIGFRTATQKGWTADRIGLDNILVTWDNPSPIYYMEYDYGTTQSSVEPTISTGGGPSPAAYNIPLTGKTANSWVYVSFPIAVSGNVQDILNDATLGDSGTTWTVAKSWDNTAKKWLTYRVGGTANTLTTVNNQMGVWLWITTNGGNQMLTTGVTGLYPTSGVGISLKAGWNMVGYPSATSRLASVTLPGVADMVSVWSASSPYITDYADKASVTMSQGNAYWVRVTTDVTWTVAV